MQPTLKTSTASPANAERIIQRISDIRDLCRHLARIGYEAGLHRRNLDDPRQVGNPPPPWPAQ